MVFASTGSVDEDTDFGTQSIKTSLVVFKLGHSQSLNWMENFK